MPENRLESEYLEPYNSWQQNPSPEAASGLLTALDPVIRQGVRTHGGAAASPVLHVQARKMVLDALPRYDPRQSSLRTFLGHQLRGLNRLAQRHLQVLKVPERAALEQQHLHRATAELRDQLGREPSDTELSDHLSLPIARIAKIRSLTNSAMAEGTLWGLGRGRGEEGPIDPAVRAQDDDPWLDFVYHSLEPRDQLVLDHTLGRHGRPQLSNQDLARRLGISPAAVSQRKAKIQQLLDERDRLNVL